MPDPTENTLIGTILSEAFDGTQVSDLMIGLDGDDTLTGSAGNDVIHGDHAQENLLAGTSGASGFQDYADTGNWTITELAGGHQSMSQSLSLAQDGVYRLSFDLAANFSAGLTNASIEVLVDGAVVGTFSSESGAFSTFETTFAAQSDAPEITIRSIQGESQGPVIDTSGPAFHYDKEVEIGGQTITVSAFADGQSNLYQVLNGTLHVFDVETQTYEVAGVAGTVNVNSMGYNAEDDLLYAIAVSNGVDSLGNAVQRSDLIMLDAEGHSYRIGETPYRSWTGDFDDQGNLWSFESSMDRIAVIDVDTFDENGNPEVTVHHLPRSLVQHRVYDVAYDAGSQKFYGVARPPGEGQNTILLVVDISSGEPTFSTVPVTSTVVDGQTLAGAPAITFGAAIVDADGTLYVGGNSGDHDMNNSTRSSGGIYQVIIDPDTGEAALHLITNAPRSYSNDGAADPTAESPFSEVDLSSSVLLRDLELVATTEGALTYDDHLSGNAGHDTISGGIGTDALIGGSAGDELRGEDGSDYLHGGAGPNYESSIISDYAGGLRYDQYGNLLPEDDDLLSGGAGDDTLEGSAGHDTLDGGANNDVLNGGSGSDALYGGTGDDLLSGGGQDDTLDGGSGADTLDGGSGDDALSGGAGSDLLRGGSGDDTLNGGGDADTLEGGSGHDALSGGAADDSLVGGSGEDTLNGDDGADTLRGGSGDDQLDGGAGSDDLRGGVNDDVLTGGLGRDSLRGDSGNDVLNGGDDRDYLSGASGNDTLDGGAGGDRLYLGAGADLASGGSGADRFIFRSDDLDGSTDRILDFDTDGGDRLDFRRLELGASDAEHLQWFATHVTNSGDDLQISLSNSTTLVLDGTAADLGDLYGTILF
ncbi:calcium-binding protein [Shimia sp. MMG029]|uniref:calcium-binding protein n=1 Tax=Shimia sp. MMG029 TaxID=3021978 RepID=UPI0022FEB84B|nr:calcium-binding protein [Shimia sp. MMG029]MDA5558171.1 calcium-binding protein [Shimia sp. MMG029]